MIEEGSRLAWGNDRFTLELCWGDETPLSVAGVRALGHALPVHRVPAVEVVAVSHGRRPASPRLAHSDLGTRFRYVSHEVANDADRRELVVIQRAGEVEARWQLVAHEGIAGARSVVTVVNRGTAPLVLQSVASWSAGFTLEPADEVCPADPLEGWERICGRSDWLGEGRWYATALRGADFPRLGEPITGNNPRGCLAVTSDGTWSTGAAMPVAAVAHTPSGMVLAWQIEHNGAWRWELGEDSRGGYLAVSGPTDSDSGWIRVLENGDAFETVPVALVLGKEVAGALTELTGLRRRTRRPHPDNERMSVVFNDFMNTLDGDPSTGKLLPLVAAAADIGAEIFCIDAGWYDESGRWWASVGAWTPSTTRFPNGLEEVVDAIRAAGMVPGLWLEPEVVGVRSPIAAALAPEAFLQRCGVRVVEHDRYHLDLRHPAAVAHLDAVVDRLISDFGIGYFKFDYNINPGAGTDVASASPGDGLLAHNRAHLAWLDAVLDRHPSLVIENCASGAMRADFAMLSRLSLQSTSDQQDFLRYPPIAASAPLAMLPEQAASWAYPQPGMSEEEIAFCLVTGLLGRFYVSGHVDEMTGSRRALVSEAVALAKSIRSEIAGSAPIWPLGLPGWEDEVVALGLVGVDSTLVSVWNRGGHTSSTVLHLPHLLGLEPAIRTVFPTTLLPWPASWDAQTATLTVRHGAGAVAARTLRLDVGPRDSIPRTRRAV